MSVFIEKTVSIVGCPPAFRERVQQAASALTACGLDARCQPWDGTRRDVVLVNPTHPIGQSAYRVSTRRGTRIVIVGRSYPDAGLAENSDVETIGTVLRNALGLDAACGRPAGTLSAPSPIALQLAATATPEAEEVDINATLLSSLAAPIAAGKDFWLRSGRESILIRPDAGQIHARHELVLGVLRAQLLRNLWSVEPIGDEPPEIPPHATSLESFLVEACLRLQYKLPPYPAGPARLTVFPDLGSLAGHPDMLRVARQAMRGFASAEELAQATSVPLLRVNAMLWATRACGLIKADTSPQPQSAPAKAPASSERARNVWQRMAKRFGLFQSGAHHD